MYGFIVNMIKDREILVLEFVFLDNGKDIAFAIDERNDFNLRMCDAHLEDGDLVLTPTNYTGTKQLVLKYLKRDWIKRINESNKVVIVECRKDKSFGDIVEVNLD